MSSEGYAGIGIEQSARNPVGVLAFDGEWQRRAAARTEVGCVVATVRLVGAAKIFAIQPYECTRGTNGRGTRSRTRYLATPRAVALVDIARKPIDLETNSAAQTAPDRHLSSFAVRPTDCLLTCGNRLRGPQ
jgi:hypothetical protein